MRWLFFIKSMAAIIAAFALLGWSVKTAGGGGPVLKARTQLTGSALSWAWVAGINIAIAGKTTLALNMVSPSPLNQCHTDIQPDLTRYAHKTSDAYWQMLFVPLVYWSFSFIGIGKL